MKPQVACLFSPLARHTDIGLRSPMRDTELQLPPFHFSIGLFPMAKQTVRTSVSTWDDVDRFQRAVEQYVKENASTKEGAIKVLKRIGVMNKKGHLKKAFQD